MSHGMIGSREGKLDELVYRTHDPVLRCSSFEVFSVAGCIFLKYGPTLALEDIETYLDFRVAGNSEVDVMPALNDLRDFDFSCLTRDLVERVATVNEQYSGRQRTRRSYLVNNDLGFGMMRMYQILSSVRGIAPEDMMLVTKSQEDALTWLRVNP